MNAGSPLAPWMEVALLVVTVALMLGGPWMPMLFRLNDYGEGDSDGDCSEGDRVAHVREDHCDASH